MGEAGYFLQAHLTFSMVVIAASVLGHSFKRLTLPLITGYLLTGVISGPFVLDIIHVGYLTELKWINEAALAVIAFCAGAELYLPDIRKLFTIIMMHVSMITIFTLTFVPLAVLAVAPAIPFLRDFPMSCKVPIAFLCGSLMLERSPSGALAMINEMMSQGPITKTLLGVTIVSDVSLLTTFAITSSFAEAACGEGGFNAFTLISTLLTLTLCGAVGYLLGKIIIFIMWIPRVPVMARGAIVLPLGYLVFYCSRQLSIAAEEHTPLRLSLEPILCCVVASCVAGNATSNRRQFANILHTSAPYIFVPFFALSGANMDLLAMYKGLPFAIVLVLSRICAIASATYLGGRFIAKENPMHYKFLWMTLLPQAGPLLGLVNEIKEYGDWAKELAACCIAALIINHVVGLKLFKWALVLVGEAFKQVPTLAHGDVHVESTEEEKTKDRTMEIRLFGINNISLAIAAKLAESSYRVEIVPSKLMEQKAVQNVFRKRQEELKQHNPNVELDLCPYTLDQHFIRRIYSEIFGENEEADITTEFVDTRLKVVTPLLEAICPEGCHTLVFTFPFDSFNYMTIRLLSLCRKLSSYKKVVVLIRDPHMAEKYEKLGVIPIYSLSAIAEVFAQISRFDNDEAHVSLNSDVGYWSKMIHATEMNTTCKLAVKDLNGDFASLEDFDLDNFSKLNALGLADASASVLKFEPKFEYPLPLADTEAGGDVEDIKTEIDLREKMKNLGKVFRRGSGNQRHSDPSLTLENPESGNNADKSSKISKAVTKGLGIYKKDGAILPDDDGAGVEEAKFDTTPVPSPTRTSPKSVDEAR
eukprot:TRINITY_DN2697_c0_g1_i2.p1 TRINITY_DN2697_c0_g1~~TRINITY_DN2697_c0_g1_i2.p1  ORF type:complete len:814 (-),score=227.86 TRINITY_DN2697_c0_g1_i2:948-3389(-)